MLRFIMPCFTILKSLDLKSRKILGTIRTAFGEINPQISDSNYLLNHWKCTCKISWGNTIFVEFSKAFDSIHREDEANTNSIWSPKETYSYNDALKNTNATVHVSDGNTNFFDIVIGVLAPYLFIICLDYTLWTSIKDNSFKFKKKAGSRQYPTETMPDADYWTLLANTTTQAEFLLQSL